MSMLIYYVVTGGDGLKGQSHLAVDNRGSVSVKQEHTRPLVVLVWSVKPLRNLGKQTVGKVSWSMLPYYSFFLDKETLSDVVLDSL